MDNNLTWTEFEKVAMHVGTIINVADFPEARKPKLLESEKLRHKLPKDILKMIF